MTMDFIIKFGDSYISGDFSNLNVSDEEAITILANLAKKCSSNFGSCSAAFSTGDANDVAIMYDDECEVGSSPLGDLIATNNKDNDAEIIVSSPFISYYVYTRLYGFEVSNILTFTNILRNVVCEHFDDVNIKMILNTTHKDNISC